MTRNSRFSCILLLALAPSLSLAQSKPATEATKAANAAVREQLPFSDIQDFADAKRGFIAAIKDGKIENAQGRAIWDLGQFAFVNPAADTPARSLKRGPMKLPSWPRPSTECPRSSNSCRRIAPS